MITSRVFPIFTAILVSAISTDTQAAISYPVMPNGTISREATEAELLKVEEHTAKQNAQKAPARDELEQLIWQNLDPRTVYSTLFDNDYKGLSVSGSARQFFDKTQVLEHQRQVVKAMSEFEIKKFIMIDRVSAGRFTSVVYEVEVQMKLGRTRLQAEGIFHEIWERRDFN